jgi:hypothetical protein
MARRSVMLSYRYVQGLPVRIVCRPAVGVTHSPVHRRRLDLARLHLSHHEKVPELRLPYITLGQPLGNGGILMLHGTTGHGDRFLSYDFGGELFAPTNTKSRNRPRKEASR